MLGVVSLALLSSLLLLFPSPSTPRTLAPEGINGGGVSYWGFPLFANALSQGQWCSVECTNCWCTSNYNQLPSPQFADGLPQYLLSEQVMIRGIVYSLHADQVSPSLGIWNVSWSGKADIRLNYCSYLSHLSASPASGSYSNGNRIYNCTSLGGGDVEIYAIDKSTGLKGLWVMLPDPKNPHFQSLDRDTLFYPTYLDRLRERDWEFYRTMDLTVTNDNPQQDWKDRRLPSNFLQEGVINPRSPAPSYQWAGINHSTGLAYEYITMLANELGHNLWLNVPHLATDDFITNLARLVLYGSDGQTPAQNSIYPPLDPSLKVYIEYSNEIWSSGSSFAQGNWAQDQANQQGITKAQFNANQFCHVFSIFKKVFAEQNAENRLVFVAATWAGSTSYTSPFLDQMAVQCPKESPAVAPDALAITTYFGNGIQDYVWDEGWWNYSSNDPYWNSQLHQDEILEAFNEWDLRQLSESSDQGGGFDATSGMTRIVHDAFEFAQNFQLGPLWLVAYEGGPSIYTNMYDNGSGNTSGITRWMEDMNNNPRIKQSYNIALALANNAGLETHSIFTDIGSWSKYGQWGHLEQVDEPLAKAYKWQFVRDYFVEFQGINPLAEQVGNPPYFPTQQPPIAAPDGELLVQWGETFKADLSAEGGMGTLSYETICDVNLEGLSSNGAILHGCPNASGVGYHLLRALDQQGNAVWSTFQLRYYGNPGSVLDLEFWSAPNPGESSAWMGTLFLDDDRVAKYSGLTKGSGTSAYPGNYSYYFRMRSPADPETLDWALGNNTYLSFTLQASSEGLDLRSATVTFTIDRYQYHAPRNFAWFTSLGGFSSSSDMIYTTGHFTSQSPQFFSFSLPSTSQYLLKNGGSVEMRMYGYEGQYSHVCELQTLAVTSMVTKPPPPNC